MERARRNTWGPTADPSKSISFPRAQCGSVHAGGAHGRASQIASDPVCAMSNERQQLGLLRSKGWNPGWLAGYAAPLCSRRRRGRRKSARCSRAEQGMCCVACTFLIHFLRRHIEVSRTHSGALFIVRNCALEPGQLKVMQWFSGNEQHVCMCRAVAGAY